MQRTRGRLERGTGEAALVHLRGRPPVTQSVNTIIIYMHLSVCGQKIFALSFSYTCIKMGNRYMDWTVNHSRCSFYFDNNFI